MQTPRGGVRAEFLRHLPREPFTFAEPCCGDGFLIKWLQQSSHGKCVAAGDLYRSKEDGSHITMDHMDAREINLYQLNYAEVVITNPPYSKWMLHPIIDNLVQIAPTWMLLSSDFMHRRASAPYMKRCEKVVSAGQIRWFGDSTGRYTSCWYLFTEVEKTTRFYGMDE